MGSRVPHCQRNEDVPMPLSPVPPTTGARGTGLPAPWQTMWSVARAIGSDVGVVVFLQYINVFL